MPVYQAVLCSECGFSDENFPWSSGLANPCPQCGNRLNWQPRRMTIVGRNYSGEVNREALRSSYEERLKESRLVLKHAEAQGKLSKASLALRPEDITFTDEEIGPERVRDTSHDRVIAETDREFERIARDVHQLSAETQNEIKSEFHKMNQAVIDD